MNKSKVAWAFAENIAFAVGKALLFTRNGRLTQVLGKERRAWGWTVVLGEPYIKCFVTKLPAVSTNEYAGLDAYFLGFSHAETSRRSVYSLPAEYGKSLFIFTHLTEQGMALLKQFRQPKVLPLPLFLLLRCETLESRSFSVAHQTGSWLGDGLTGHMTACVWSRQYFEHHPLKWETIFFNLERFSQEQFDKVLHAYRLKEKRELDPVYDLAKPEELESFLAKTLRPPLSLSQTKVTCVNLRRPLAESFNWRRSLAAACVIGFLSLAALSFQAWNHEHRLKQSLAEHRQLERSLAKEGLGQSRSITTSGLVKVHELHQALKGTLQKPWDLMGRLAAEAGGKLWIKSLQSKNGQLQMTLLASQSEGAFAEVSSMTSRLDLNVVKMEDSATDRGDGRIIPMFSVVTTLD